MYAPNSQNSRLVETASQRQKRLLKYKRKHQNKLANETPEAKRARLDFRNAKLRETRLRKKCEREMAINAEALAEQEVRIAGDREHGVEARGEEESVVSNATYNVDLERSIEKFKAAINTYSAHVCDVCTKRCYDIQIKRCPNPSTEALDYLPLNLVQKGALSLCHRCYKHLTSKKTSCPPKAYWNKLALEPIPDVLGCLTQAERRLLARVNVFLKIIKFDGCFGQYGFRGQAILFAQDIFEVTEQVLKNTVLPLSTNDCGLVIMTEHLENIDRVREYTINRANLFNALRWLKANNPLYKDIVIDYEVDINENDLIRITQPVMERVINDTVILPDQQDVSAYIKAGESARIIRASFHQGNDSYFRSENAGKQCAAMVLANLVRASLMIPSRWDKLILDSNMIEGDCIYQTIKLLTLADPNALPLDENGYLEVKHFDVIKSEFIMYDHYIAIEYAEDTPFTGSMMDRVNINKEDSNWGVSLLVALKRMFENHHGGILICDGQSLGVMKFYNKFYLTNSHSCGVNGAKAYSGNGRACVIECDSIKELVRKLKRVTGSKNTVYTLDFITVTVLGQHDNGGDLQQGIVQSGIPMDHSTNIPQSSLGVENREIPIQSSVMASIDARQPDVDDEVEVSDHLNEIVRKTGNIVNEAHELKAEEYGWFNLFPHGVNGFKEEREVPITPLDYYQSRILGNDRRFHSTDYVFYAFSMSEYYNIKRSINVCGKKIQRGDGNQVEDIHLYLKNLRGTAAYWRAASNDLIAQIRCLGPPTYFVTFSCNDLNWLDMRKALLIADGRPDEDPQDLDMFSTQKLVEKYPVVVSQHFMIRVKALLILLKSDETIFGGKLVDWWWRIEFQNRGSPHLHMVLYIENHPSFDTPEGIARLDKVVTCAMPDEGSDMHELVKKSQIHHHTFTCKKNDPSSNVCRFSFPRQVNTETRRLSESSDEFIRNGGRMFLLKRRLQDRWVNNYNSILLKLWEGNMDIQPCGSNEAVAYYIAKYTSKGEPADLSVQLAQAIRDIRMEDTNLSRKLFKIAMRIHRERQVSACEAVFRLAHLPLRGSSRSVVFLNSRKPDSRYKVLRFDENTGRATGYCNSIFERYENRPNSNTAFNFDNMCILEFAMLFEPCYQQQEDECEDVFDIDSDSRNPRSRKIITLLNGSRMYVRNKPCVVRTPYLNLSRDRDEYFYSYLVLYKPFRHEDELLNGFNTAREAFADCEEELKRTSAYMELFRKRDKELERAFNQMHAFDVLDRPETFVEDDFVEEEQGLEEIMPVGEFAAAQARMNVGQREIFRKITSSVHDQMMNNSTDRLKLFITGNAGTGKTFVFKLLQNQVNSLYGKRVTKTAALTGVAARLVGGQTIHSLFKLPVQKDGKDSYQHKTLPLLTGNYLRTMQLSWKDTEFLFIDEISMVSYEMLIKIHSRLQQLKDNDELFGGINVLVFGDLLQLPPVLPHQIFDQPPSLVGGTHLWQKFSLVELTENMRQQGDTTFIDVLNALRIGELNTTHMSILLSKVSKEATGEFSMEKALRIYPTNVQVDAHNQRVLEKFRNEGVVSMFIIEAVDTLIDDAHKVDKATMERITPTDINKTGALPKKLELFKGAKVMLRSNIDVGKGLVNGSMGYVRDFRWPLFMRNQLDCGQLPNEVLIEFDGIGEHWIKPIEKEFEAGYNFGLICRRMLPIVLCWATSIHKMQGSTVDYAVIDLGKKIFAPGQAYVALSRVRSLDGLQIVELDPTKLVGKKPCNLPALREMARLRSIQ